MRKCIERVPVMINRDNFGYASIQYSDQELIIAINNSVVETSGTSPFKMLSQIRKELEKEKLFLVINGSRIDVYPSGLSLTGYNAYVQVLQKPAILGSLVHIFKETDRRDLIGTVEQQTIYHQNWIKSL